MGACAVDPVKIAMGDAGASGRSGCLTAHSRGISPTPCRVTTRRLNVIASRIPAHAEAHILSGTIGS